MTIFSTNPTTTVKEETFSLGVIKNPFSNDNIDGCSMFLTNGFNRKYWWGQIKFRNGNTFGEQRTPDCESFEQLLEEMNKIVKSLK